MGLPNLLDAPPGERGFNEFIFDHAQDHIAIVQALQAQGHKMVIYPLDPFTPSDPTNWLEMHQQAHRDMDAVLGTEAVDLTHVDFTEASSRAEFYWSNFAEHRNAHSRLGI